MNRYLQPSLLEDLKEKMVFLGGPRQVGKTTLAKNLIVKYGESHSSYFNWDIVINQKGLLQGDLPKSSEFIVLDEIHKYKKWRNLVKGYYDEYKEKKSFLVTGSARLDFFRRGGDSLQGRYHYYNLHPFSIFEVNTKPSSNDLEQLLKFGGFPEPFLKANSRQWKRWQLERTQRVIQEDLVSLERVNELSQLSLLAGLLPDKVGSLLSVSNLSQDLGTSFVTVDRWINILERLYYCFRIQAYGFSQIRAAKKEKKLYMWDWSLVHSAPARFENLVASNLLKYCDLLKDRDGERMELRFVRDSNRREIDFIILKNNKPDFAVECKTGESEVSPQIRYFSSRLNIPKYYQVHLGKKHVEKSEFKTEIIPFTEFAKTLGV